MLKYGQISDGRNVFRQRAEDGFGHDNDKFFSQGLKDFKRIVREVTDSMASLNEGANQSFNLELIKRGMEEKERILHHMILCFIHDPTENITIQNKKKDCCEKALENIISYLENHNIEIFEFLPLPVLCFDYESESTRMSCYFKISDKRSGKIFFTDVRGCFYSSPCTLTEKNFSGESLVCYPRESSYEVDQNLRIIPLEFISLPKSNISKLLLFLADAPLSLFIEMTSGRFSKGLMLVTFASLKLCCYYLGKSRGPQTFFFDGELSRRCKKFIKPVIQAAITYAIETGNFGSINGLILSSRTQLRSPGEGDEIFYQINKSEGILQGLNEAQRRIQGDNYPYKSTRDYLGLIFRKYCKRDVRGFVSHLNFILGSRFELNKWDAIATNHLEENNYSLESFERMFVRDKINNIEIESNKEANEIEKFDNIRPDWSFKFFLEPINEIVHRISTRNKDLKVSKEISEAIEITKNNDVVCIILRIECNNENFINMKYGCIDM